MFFFLEYVTIIFTVTVFLIYTLIYIQLLKIIKQAILNYSYGFKADLGASSVE